LPCHWFYNALHIYLTRVHRPTPCRTLPYASLFRPPHPDGAEVVFTLRQLTADDDLEQNAAAVMQDLCRLKDLLEQPRPTIVPAAAPSTAEPVIRLATAADAVAVGRMLHEFNTGFDSPTPSADRAARRFESLLRREDVLVVAHLPRPD